MTSKQYTVIGMTCEHCVAAVSAELGQLAEVAAVEVDLAGGRVTVTGDGFTDEQVRAAVDEAGYALAGG